MLRITTATGALFDLDLRTKRLRCLNESISLSTGGVQAGEWVPFTELDYLQLNLPMRIDLTGPGSKNRGVERFFLSPSSVIAVQSLQ
jgi:hypothetical protein